MIVTLIPAYGRRYTNTADMLKDWHAGKDFQIKDGPYCSIRDAEAMRYQYEIDGVRFRTTNSVLEIKL